MTGQARGRYVVVVGPGHGVPWLRLGTRDRIVTLAAAPTLAEGVAQWELGGTTRVDDGTLVEKLRAATQRRCANFGVIERAAAQGRVIPLSTLLVGAREFAWRLDAGLGGESPTGFVASGLSSFEEALLRAYARSRGLKFRALPRLGRTARRLWRSLPCRGAVTSLVGAWRHRAHRRSVSREISSRCVVLASQANATRSFLPVAKHLAVRQLAPTFLVNAEDRRSREMLEREGLSCEVLEAYGRYGDRATARRAAARLEPVFFGDDWLLGIGDFPAWVSFDDIRGQLRSVLLPAIRRSSAVALATRRALAELGASMTVFITERSLNNEILADTRSENRPVFFLQGIVPEVPPTSNRLDVDAAIVGSRIDEPYIARCGVPAERRRITGYPDYDHFPRLDREESRRSLAAAVPKWGGGPLVVFTSQYTKEVFPDWARRANLRELLETARRMPEVTFLVKAHPLRENFASGDLVEFPANAVLCPPFDTASALLAADVAVTYWSTTALEAVLLGTPLVQLNATGLPDYFDVSGRMGRPTARDAAGLSAKIGALLAQASEREAFQRDRQLFLAEYELVLDGRAAERAADAVLDVWMGHGG